MLVPMKQRFDVLILGAGASGLMCAAELCCNSRLRIGVVEGNATAGRKLNISGGGKCNITNVAVSQEHFLGECSFVRRVLEQFTKEDLLCFLHDHAIALELRKSRYYFCKRAASDVSNLLLKRARGARFFYSCNIVSAVHESEGYRVHTDQGDFYARRLVIATGGESFKHLGASRIGLELAEGFGLQSRPFSPALVGLTLQKEQFWMKELSGTSCRVCIKVGARSMEEELLFAHKGISGPAVLSASLYWNKGDICIDFLPHKNLHVFLHSKKLLSTALPLSKRFMKTFLEHIGLQDKPCHRLHAAEIERLSQLKSYCFAPAGNFGFSKAEVSRGGIDTAQLHANSLMSTQHKNLYCIGEVVDVTGELGGYNLQWAWSSAVVCARQICQSS